MFSPVCIAACLVVAGSLEAKSASSLTSQTLQLGSRLYLAEWLIWPPAQFINFYYLPTKYRHRVRHSSIKIMRGRFIHEDLDENFEK